MNSTLRRIGLIAALAVVSATIGFGVVRALESDESSVVAQQPGPTDESDLPPDVQERMEAVNNDHAKERFVGEINGITFTEDAPGPPEICTKGVVEELVGPDEFAKSDLDFSPSYLPAGFEVVFESGSACQGEIISVVRNYARKDSSEIIVVAHLVDDPVTTPEAPADRLKEATINGHPAVIQEPVYPGDKTAIYLREDDTFWIVWGQSIDSAEVLKFMEGIN